MRPRTPPVVLRRLQDGDPLARVRELLAEAVEEAVDLEDDSLERLLAAAVDEIDAALKEAEDDEGGEDDEPEANRGEPPGPRPKSGSYETAAAFRAAVRRWRQRRARYEGDAIRRGRTPGVVTSGPGGPGDDD